MRKWIIALISMVVLQQSALAFTEVLTDAIKNEKGMFFSYIAEFGAGRYLITVSETEDKIRICAFDEADGAELTDVLELDKKEGLRLAIVKSEKKEYVKASDMFYEIEDDTFRLCDVEEYNTVIRIATMKNGKLNTHKNSIGASYNLLNKLKEKQIHDYNFIDRCNSMSHEDMQSLRNIIVSAADVMSYDCKNYDIDTLMKYVINTHRNFLVALPYEGVHKEEKDGIKLADAEYIDYIIRNMFGAEPEHPPVNELVSKGYCYSGKYYMYTNAFNVNFATEVCNIEAVYDVSEGVYYIIFGDIYTEGKKSIPEYSYIILKERENGYNILKLEMGGELLSEREVMSYAGVNEIEKYSWEKSIPQTKQIHDYTWVWWSVAAAAMILTVIILCKRRKG